MAGTARSSILLAIRTAQRIVDLALWVVLLGFLVLFGLQFPHSGRLDGLWLIQQLHQRGDPIVAGMGSWINSSWPSSSTSFLPLGAALATWVVILFVDAVFLRSQRLIIKKRVSGAEAEPPQGVEVGGTDLAGINPDSEKAREQLLRRYRQIEEALKSSKRKRCTFLSIDIVGSTQMKVGEPDTAIAATFQAYEEMLKKFFEQYGAWKQAWTPDGVMICFLQSELAVGAAQRVLQSLKMFNEKDNKLRTPFRVRCGLNEGEVSIFEDTKLEKVADRVIDVAGHMQKQGTPDTLWLSAETYERLPNKSGFRATDQVVDGLRVYEWAAESNEPKATTAAS